MIRFSIRELMLLTVVASLAIGWWVQARHDAVNIAALKAQVESMETRATLLRKFRIRVDLLNRMRGQFDEASQIERVLETIENKPAPPPTPLQQLILEGNRA